ncbi:glycoside hydrolase family 104 protein [Synechococcus sp. PCC 6312]|uniref:glycoside hydrolase family 24 protein n=1 Tax=Synechococcus sp. (strain ATCC 27167 / PCC 6312) TaxID=195253 RepID=UPI00029EF145|nr:glycoside hydrolase family 104 protein [Synechococcus sp. PCC 6312]AFY60341.1 muramidase (phage lambda lysozyme) [Synechococcus sp. PCC 6312]
MNVIEAILKPTDRWQDTIRGRLRVFALDLVNNGKRVDQVPVFSGAPRAQELVDPRQDYSGSLRPIPEGIYKIGQPEEHPQGDWGPGIGRLWIPLEVLPEYRVNNRGDFGIHLDSNFATSPGSAGCPVAQKMPTLQTILGWLFAKARPKWLVVDHGQGLLKARGYQYLNFARNPAGVAGKPWLRYPINNTRRAWLDLIAWAEGTGKHPGEEQYRVMFTHKLFSGYADHPRQIQGSGRLRSDAAGRYQFLSTTWDEAKRALGLPSFSPECQDQAALWLIDKKRGALNLIDSGIQIESALNRLSWEWASLPPGRYGQPVRTYAECVQFIRSWQFGVLD